MQPILTTDSTGPGILWRGGVGVFLAYFRAGTGYLRMQYLPLGLGDTEGNWLDVLDCQLSATGLSNFTLPPGHIRAKLQNSQSASIEYDIRGALGPSLVNFGGSPT